MAAGAARSNRNLVLVAMIFAVAMTFIDQTIVAIASPELNDLSLSETRLQWIINGYLLFGAVQLDFAQATRSVFYVMAGLMALSLVIALIGHPGGKTEDPDASVSR